MIGVSGMRGTIGGTLTPAVVTRMASAFAVWLHEGPAPANGRAHRVVFGRDSRPSGNWVQDAASAALIAAGIELIDLDIVTTPGVAMMLKHLGADAGIIATASHNPIEWNGLKFLNRNAVAPRRGMPRRFENCMTKVAHASRRFTIDSATPQQRNACTARPASARTRGWSRHLLQAIQSRPRQRQRAGCVATATMLNKLGCQLIHLNGIPNGKFAHEPEPTDKNLTGLADEVRRQKAAVGSPRTGRRPPGHRR